MAFSLSLSSSSNKLMIVLLCVCFSYLVSVKAEVVLVLSDRTSSSQQPQLLEWTTNASSGSDQSIIMDEDEEDLAINGDDFSEDGIMRRALYARQKHYYISYGALSANRVPCPPRSGRSYYTNNCYKARQPAQPYSRGCSRITRCRR
ncbi:protein RALF-like 34 [Papaver somniferum]|uniref:protein RALF-like 34 n=1 Tax=Papaver somniferum TaxID=3469 RepID=UPI000E6FB2E2|nr:protein RALF-like 34 [Papaver somniferum]